MTIDELIVQLNKIKESEELPTSGDTPVVFRQFATDPGYQIHHIERNQKFDLSVQEVVLS